jgi:threonine/homoserine efflux transporter RhtA
MTKFFGWLLMWVGGTGLAVFLSFFRGTVLAKIWLWFIVPLGYPAYSWRVFFAVALLVTILVPSTMKNTAEEDENWMVFGNAVGLLVFSFLVAYVIHRWV